MAVKKKLKIVLVNDQSFILDALCLLLETSGQYEVIAQITDRDSLFTILDKHKPDIVLADLLSEGSEGFDTISLLRHGYPWLKVVVLSEQSIPSLVNKLRRMGVKGFVAKNAGAEELFSVIGRVAAGESAFPVEIHRSNRGVSEKHLTLREIEIVKLIQTGLTNKQISESMDISVKTVEAHRNNISNKLNLKNSAELIKYAQENQLI